MHEPFETEKAIYELTKVRQNIKRFWFNNSKNDEMYAIYLKYQYWQTTCPSYRPLGNVANKII